jgi:hypothetical protein
MSSTQASTCDHADYLTAMSSSICLELVSFVQYAAFHPLATDLLV